MLADHAFGLVLGSGASTSIRVARNCVLPNPLSNKAIRAGQPH